MRTNSLLLAVLLAGCGTERPSLGGRADTADAPQGSAPLPAGELAYVTNEDSQELTVIDTRTDSVVATIPVGTRPRGVRIAPDGKTVFVALSGSPKCPPTMPDEECEKMKADKTKDGIAAVDVASRKVTRVLPGGSDPETFDISKDGSTLFVSNEDADSATIVDAASGKIRLAVPVGREPEGVRLQPDGSAVWVTGETDHNLTLLDTQTGKVLGNRERGKAAPGPRIQSRWEPRLRHVGDRRDGMGHRRANEEGAEGDPAAQGLQANGGRGFSGWETRLRRQRSGRHRVGHRCGHQRRLENGRRPGSGPGESPSQRTAASCTPPMDLPTMSP